MWRDLVHEGAPDRDDIDLITETPDLRPHELKAVEGLPNELVEGGQGVFEKGHPDLEVGEPVV